MRLDEVAKRAGVSTATVSRVLNGGTSVRDNTKKRVLQAVEDLQYRPNLHARSLASGASHTIGMIVSNIENPFFLDIFCALENLARDRGYTVIVEHTDYRPDRLVASVETLLGLRPAGLAVIVSEMDPSIVEEIAARNLPAVFFDVGHSAPKITKIEVRYEIGMRRTVEYLYSLGHRRMAFIGHHAGLAPLEARRTTFAETVRRHAADAEYQMLESNDSPAGAREAARNLLASGFQPTAILCANDFMALGVLRALREAGLSVPGDVSVTGFDNIDLAGYANPALTTVNVPRRRIGELCLEALLRSDQVPMANDTIIIDPELVVRESTGAAFQPRPGRKSTE
jgi:LacI family transcriptional regulator